MKIWDINPYGGGGGDSSTYSNPNPTPADVGGIDAGTTFSNKTMKEMWDMLLYAYLDPAFTAFTISGVSSPLEVGASVPASKTFTWSTSNSGNVSPNSLSIADVTGGTTLASSLANTGSYTHSGDVVTKIIATNNVWRITANQLEGSPISRTHTISWQWKRFYGESASTTLDEAGITGLRVSGLSGSIAATYNFNAGGYKYICCSSDFSISSMKDASTGFNIPYEAPYLVDVTNSFGVTKAYKVYRTTNILGGAVNIIVT